ncbi:MAG: aminotransferase class V-fold PLP-dependent enzyme [Bacteroidetes bacterium]|nr:aminotransferase class V-fold PLP-dependent enzyme [Bacteroidota bacterium]
MHSRRDFIKKSTAFTGLYMAQAIGGTTISRAMSDIGQSLLTHSKIAGLESNLETDESFWAVVRDMFPVQEKFINLENGYFSAQPLGTLGATQDAMQRVNTLSSYFMRQELESEYALTKQAIGDFAGLDTKEFVICRNTTEALDTVIHGLNWQKGDEVVLSLQDYGSMQEALRQESKRTGLVLSYVELPLRPGSDEEVIHAYQSKITAKTRLVLLTHMINLTGQVLPVKELIKMVHGAGALALLDSAHAFAHLPFSVKDLDPDFMGTSLHKWLCSPLGSGMLYMKPSLIAEVWPLFGDDSFPIDDIRKFEHWGTRPVWAYSGIRAAIDFHKSLGTELIHKRLYYLKQYWTTKVVDAHGVNINTPFASTRSGGIGNFSIQGKSPKDVCDRLFNEFGIFTVAIDNPEVKGVRVTPHLYTQLWELDKLVEAIKHLAN